MQREDIINLIFDGSMKLIYSVFELITKEEGTELIHILEEQPPMSNNWVYVTKKDFKDYLRNKNHKCIRVANGKDIISLEPKKDLRLSR
jgi:hypothetical protein